MSVLSDVYMTYIAVVGHLRVDGLVSSGSMAAILTWLGSDYQNRQSACFVSMQGNEAAADLALSKLYATGACGQHPMPAPAGVSNQTPVSSQVLCTGRLQLLTCLITVCFLLEKVHVRTSWKCPSMSGLFCFQRQTLPEYPFFVSTCLPMLTMTTTT